ncbi:uncharacterized protein LOC129572588 [Sitodiplosis mosellana]|uniref:uncharacterized protein LOC129572588 n=1 Tax=Sitodiplosis mosellana TaxID=263140 RepID=UPI0024448ED3|nr:uncharacterized protein LOC129572588 [Sitodiplosis mosellana]
MSGKSFIRHALRTVLLFLVVAFQFLHGIDAKSVRLPSADVEHQLEYHFHTYFDFNDPVQVSHAIKLRNGVIANCVSKKIIGIARDYHYDPEKPVLEHNNDTIGLIMKPFGPHPIGQFETWIPVEYFAKAYEWFVQNRGPLTIFVHPRTPHEMTDHVDRIVFMGKSYTLDPNGLAELSEFIPNFKSQYAYLRMGFTNPANHNLTNYSFNYMV